MDESRDESFELLSSMSPRVDKTKRKLAKKKAPTKLALKKTMRRSSFFDKLPPTVQNRHVRLAYGSSDPSSDSSSKNTIKANAQVDSDNSDLTSKNSDEQNRLDNDKKSDNSETKDKRTVLDLKKSCDFKIPGDYKKRIDNSDNNSKIKINKRVDNSAARVDNSNKTVDISNKRGDNSDIDNFNEKVDDSKTRRDESNTRIHNSNTKMHNSNTKVDNSNKRIDVNAAIDNSNTRITNSNKKKLYSNQNADKHNFNVENLIVSKQKLPNKGISCKKQTDDCSTKIFVPEHKMGKHNPKKHQEECITVIDSDEERSKRGVLLSNSKFRNIQKWIDEVSPADDGNDNCNVSIFSQISSIEGDLRTERNSGALNSTAIPGSVEARFDELFKKAWGQFEELHVSSSSSRKSGTKEKKVSIEKSEIDDSFDEKVRKDSLEKSVIDDSLEQVIEDSFDKNVIEDSLEKIVIEDSFEVPKVDERKEKATVIEDLLEENKENVDVISEGFLSPEMESEYMKILDKHYGNDWRKNRNQVFPKSEPRPKKTNDRMIRTEIPKTEIKARPSGTHKNPYLFSESKKSQNLLNILESARRLAALESPWVLRLKNLCDSDSEGSTKQNKELSRVQLHFEEITPNHPSLERNERDELSRVKLQFDGNSEKEGRKYRTKKTSSGSDEKYYSLSDSSDIGLSLEDKLKGVKPVKKIPKPKTKKSTVTNAKIETVHKPKDSKTNSNSDIKSSGNGVHSKPAVNTETKGIPRNGNYSDFSDDGLTLAEKLKGIQVGKKKAVPVPAKVRSRKVSISSSSSDDINTKISEFENIFNRIDLNAKPTPKVRESEKKPLSFLASLSENIPLSQCDASARIFKSSYKKYRQELLEKLFKMYNDNIFANALPANMLIEWSDRMRGTAGYCACKKLRRRTGQIERTVRLMLSTKVLDSASRLRDTLVHEMCHAATWIINEVSDGHGPYWKSWAAKAMRVFPELPPIKRCHDYVINTKYTYRCTDCGYSIGRHTKSVDVNKKRCGHCYGKLEVLLNKVTKDGETKTVPATPKKEASGFALFVKENYADHKSPGIKHGDIMRLLGKKFQESKVDKN